MLEPAFSDVNAISESKYGYCHNPPKAILAVCALLPSEKGFSISNSEAMNPPLSEKRLMCRMTKIISAEVTLAHMPLMICSPSFEVCFSSFLSVLSFLSLPILLFSFLIFSFSSLFFLFHRLLQLAYATRLGGVL